jgi:hypothetical protein
MRCKYVIVPDGFGNEAAMLLDPILNHSDAGIKRVIAAGECDIERFDWRGMGEEIIVHAYGRSISCGVESRMETDAKLIHQALTRS